MCRGSFLATHHAYHIILRQDSCHMYMNNTIALKYLPAYPQRDEDAFHANPAMQGIRIPNASHPQWSYADTCCKSSAA